MCRSCRSEIWGYGVLVGWLVARLFVLFYNLDLPWLQQLVLGFLLIHSGWIVIAVWRCAPNASQEWHGLLARAMTIAWALNAAFMLLFLELDFLSARLQTQSGFCGTIAPSMMSVFWATLMRQPMSGNSLRMNKRMPRRGGA